MIQFILVFDLETFGLPKSREAPIEDNNNWPKILEIGWQLLTNNGELINESSYLIRPSDNETIPNEIEELTGISTQTAEEFGVSIITALNFFTKLLKKFNPILVSHNIEFDTKILKAAFFQNKLNISLDAYQQICTMKESAAFCNLPNLKWPKLEELYFALFGSKPKLQHRAIYDVQFTTDSFLELVKKGIIIIENSIPTNSNDPNKINDAIVKKAILDYLSDLNEHPIFYDHSSIEELKNDKFSEVIIEEFNKFYQPSKGKLFEIPYNQIADRKVIALKPRDIIIRYVLRNQIKQFSNFFMSIELFDDNTVAKLFQKNIESGKRVLTKIDVQDCYESINHIYLVNMIAELFSLKVEESIFVSVFANSLKIIFESEGEICKKEKGLLIGSKPDQYFAEYFLSKVEFDLKCSGITIIRFSDDFTFFSSNIKEARKDYLTILGIFNNYGLQINKAKTVVHDYRNDVLTVKHAIELIEATYNSFHDKVIPERFSLIIPETGAVINKSYLFGNVNFSEKMTEIKETATNENGIVINSYETAISFLKALSSSKADIIDYQTKHPDFKYLHNIVFSQPTEFLKDFEKLNIAILTEVNIANLRKVIFQYPKHEYFSALALELLVFAATNTIHCTDTFEGLKGLNYVLTLSCELANVTIVEILESEDIHLYQKYILLRCLFKNKNDLNLKLNNYFIKTQNYMDNEHYNDRGEFDFSPSLPFKEEVLKIVKLLASNSEYYPLKMICSELSGIIDGISTKTQF